MANDGPKKRGRKRGDLPRSQIEARATEARRNRILNEENKKRLDTYVEAETKIRLQSLKKIFDVSTEGEVIDRLVAAAKVK